jgi:hypothetical protein
MQKLETCRTRISKRGHIIDGLKKIKCKKEAVWIRHFLIYKMANSNLDKDGERSKWEATKPKKEKR